MFLNVQQIHTYNGYKTRIVHRILPTNSLLLKIKIKENNLCTFCQVNEETLVHLFYECCKIKPLIQYISMKISEFNEHFEIHSLHIILGSCQKNYEIDIVFLEFKRYVFLCRNKNQIPTIEGLKNSFKLALNIHNKTKSSEADKDIWAIVRCIN